MSEYKDASISEAMTDMVVCSQDANPEERISKAEFGMTPEEVSGFVELYLTRTAHEDVDYLKNVGISNFFSALNCDLNSGIKSDADVIRRREYFGKNSLPQKKRITFLRLIWDAMKDFLLRLLLLFGLISLVLGLFGEHPSVEWIEGFAIWLAVIIVALVTAGNDLAKERQFEKLNKVQDNKKFSVIREGKQREIYGFDIVVGDVITFEGGDEVPADAIVFECHSLRSDESSLTGEPNKIKKRVFEGCVEEIEALETPATSHRQVCSPLLLSGSTISSGSGKAIILAVGVNSVIGTLYTKMMTAGTEQTPLQNKLNALAHDIGKAGLISAAVCFVILFVEYWIMWFIDDSLQVPAVEVTRTMFDYVIIAITVVVVAVPEGLPLAVTLSLAYSIGRMLKDQNYVRRLAACEIMGGANEICSDKTGTLTENKMSVQAFWNGSRLEIDLDNDCGNLPPLPPAPMQIFIDGIAINNLAYLERKPRAVAKGAKSLPDELIRVGSSTDCALLLLCERLNFDYKSIRDTKGASEMVIHREPFSSERKMMTTVIKLPASSAGTSEKYRIFVKGASEKLLTLCNMRIDSKGFMKTIDDVEKARIEKYVINQLASKALRTLCIAYKDIDPVLEPNWQEFYEDLGVYKMEMGLTCLAIVGISDPVRAAVPQSIKSCQAAGIKVRMITGDNLETASQIAIKCNIYHPEANGLAMLGPDFTAKVGGVVCSLCKTQMCDCPIIQEDVVSGGKPVRVDVLGDPEEFRSISSRLEVLARSRPSDKYALIVGLRNEGAVVAVTGDGTNDAPALKKADVGFAMGITGKEVAKQAADIVLLDDNFESIVKAVMWGRNIFSNIRRFLQFQLTVNLVAVLSSILCVTIIRQPPFTAVQLLWVNLIMDSLASLALATEPPSQDLLKQKPHKRDEYLVSGEMFGNIIGLGIYQLIVVFVLVFAGDLFIPEQPWSLLTPEMRVEHGFCEFGDCQDMTVCLLNCTGSFIRSGRQYFAFSPSEDYQSGWIYDVGASRHFTIVFNTFVLMQIVNLFAARRLGKNANIFESLLANPLWIGVFVLITVLQALIVEFGSVVMACHPEGLTPYQWLISVAFALGIIPTFYLIRLFPRRWFPQAGKKEIDMSTEPHNIALASRGRFSRQRISAASFTSPYVSENLGHLGGSRMIQLSNTVRRQNMAGESAPFK